jgi:hypothetical protein
MAQQSGKLLLVPTSRVILCFWACQHPWPNFCSLWLHQIVVSSSLVRACSLMSANHMWPLAFWGLWLFPLATQYAPGTVLPSERVGIFPGWALGGPLGIIGLFTVGSAVPRTCSQSRTHCPGTLHMIHKWIPLWQFPLSAQTSLQHCRNQRAQLWIVTILDPSRTSSFLYHQGETLPANNHFSDTKWRTIWIWWACSVCHEP